MNWIVSSCGLIPLLPLVAAGVSAVLPRRRRRWAAALAVGSMCLALAMSCVALAHVIGRSGLGEVGREYLNFPWFEFGDSALRLGWVLDALSGVMLVMVAFVALLIFVYSLGYMAQDENFTRFFCFLSLFAAAMLGLVIANSLLLLFMCWELVGLTSYLLIGFWYHKPSAAAAARKAFIVTRIGDLAFLLGMVWLYARSGTLLFYDDGRGCLEGPVADQLIAHATRLGLTGSTAIGLLIFLGAMGKSGQVPLHVWLPDAMEGPTPVSALIHAATMVAAGVFLVARVYPLMAPCLPVVTWVGAITAVFAATIAVAQTDIKRILAYSTISQLGFMMLGLGAGGVAVGTFHLVTHAFFKALLFLGAGSVIHSCQEEQDIRWLGGLRRLMPITFATYAVGMLALSGFPLLFSGFWSKDAILEAARGWGGSQWPFYLGLCGALLTAFYMTRQVIHVFYGHCRLALGAPPGTGLRNAAFMRQRPGDPRSLPAEAGVPRAVSGCALAMGGTTRSGQRTVEHAGPRESPRVMTVPLVILAAFSVLPGVFGTPAWPWFQGFLEGRPAFFELARLIEPGLLALLALSSAIVLAGIGLGYWLYGRKPLSQPGEPDALERLQPELFALLRRKYFVDEIYDWSFVALNARWARLCDWLDQWLWRGMVQLAGWGVVGLSWLNRLLDEHVVNPGFDAACRGVSQGGGLASRLQDGRVQHYLRVLGVALAALILFLLWGCGAS